MNLPKMIAELRAEKARLDDAILALERLSIALPKRRGRLTPRPEHRSSTLNEEHREAAEAAGAGVR